MNIFRKQPLMVLQPMNWKPRDELSDLEKMQPMDWRDHKRP